MAISETANFGCVPRVLQVTGGLEAGGSDIVVISVAEALVGRCEMDFLVFSEKEGALEDRARATGSKVLRMRTAAQIGPMRFQRELKRLIVENRYDAVHSHVNFGAGLIMRAADSAGVPVRITHSHSTHFPSRGPVHSLYQYLSRKLIAKHSTQFAACGEEAGQALFAGSWGRSSGCVIPNGINVRDFVGVRERRADIRADLGLSPEQFVVGMIARMVPEKNHDFMLEVMALDQALGGKAVLLAIGDGPLRLELEKRAEQLGLKHKVRFLGVRRDVPDLLSALDVLVLPSFFEGLGLVLIESQAAGVPALASEGVPHEGDLGLGLLTWLPLDEHSAWREALYKKVNSPAPSVILDRFDKSGYSLESSAKVFLRLYDGSVAR